MRASKSKRRVKKARKTTSTIPKVTVKQVRKPIGKKNDAGGTE